MRTPPLDAANPFVPTLARARAEHLPLPEGEPIAEERWSALIILAALLKRRSWKDEGFRHPRSIAHIQRGAPPEPQGFFHQSYVFIEEIGAAGQCPDCKATPGFRKCRVCGGSGQLRLGKMPVQCSCGGSGQIPCPNCLRQGTAERVVLRYYEDEPKIVRELYLPSHLPMHAPLFGLESAMEQAANVSRDPPEELRCHDLTGRTSGTAYRGGEKLVRPTFHGHDYGDTIDRSLEALKQLGAGGQVIRYDIRAYAWPLLRLQFPDPKSAGKPLDVVLYFNRDGALLKYEGAASR